MRRPERQVSHARPHVYRPVTPDFVILSSSWPGKSGMQHSSGVGCHGDTPLRLQLRAVIALHTLTHALKRRRDRLDKRVRIAEAGRVVAHHELLYGFSGSAAPCAVLGVAATVRLSVPGPVPLPVPRAVRRIHASPSTTWKIRKAERHDGQKRKIASIIELVTIVHTKPSEFTMSHTGDGDVGVVALPTASPPIVLSVPRATRRHARPTTFTHRYSAPNVTL